MTNDLGVWTADDCALVLIDYQKEMFEVIRSETSADLVEMHVRLLAKTAKAFDLPIVLSTVGVGAGFNGPTLPSILSELDGIEPIDRTSMNAFEDEAFSDAVKATGRKRLIIGCRRNTRDGQGGTPSAPLPCRCRERLMFHSNVQQRIDMGERAWRACKATQPKGDPP